MMMLPKQTKYLSALLGLSACPLFSSLVGATQPTELRSVDGVLDVTLTVSTVTSLNGTRIGPGYNGGPVGPTLRVHPGDRVKVTLVNDLPPVEETSRKLYDFTMDPAAVDEADGTELIKVYNRLTDSGNADSLPREQYWGRNYMNLHFHGAGVNPNKENNNVVIDGGGEQIVYEFDIPEDHPGGLSWYHNHFHGTASFSSLSGLFGAFIIDLPGDRNPYRKVADDLSSSEAILLFSETLTFEDGEPQNFIPLVMEFGWDALTNGELNPTYTFKKGETVYFRTVHAGERPSIPLSIEGHVLVPLASDSSFPDPNAGVAVETLEIGAGGRAEFSVTFDTPGTFLMRRAPWNTGIHGHRCAEEFGPPFEGLDTCISYDKETILATIVVTDEEAEKAETPADVKFAVSSYLTELTKQPSAGKRTVTMDLKAGFPIFQLPWDGVFIPPGVGVGMNNLLGNPHHFSGDITSGTCEEWTVISNPQGFLAHTFHAHSIPYLVRSIDGATVEEPFWRDTFPVLRNMTALICFPPRSDPTYINVHCHMPHHQDTGMVSYYNLLPGGMESDKADGDTSTSSTTTTEPATSASSTTTTEPETSGSNTNVTTSADGDEKPATASPAAGNALSITAALGAVFASFAATCLSP